MEPYYFGQEWLSILAFVAMYLYFGKETTWFINCIRADLSIGKGTYMQVNTIQAGNQHPLSTRWSWGNVGIAVVMTTIIAELVFISPYLAYEFCDAVSLLVYFFGVKYAGIYYAKYVCKKQRVAGLVEEFVKVDDRYYVSTDLETGDFCSPYVDENGVWQRGSETGPILQYAHIITDSELNEISRFQVFINDESRMGGFKESTRAFHVKTGFMDTWERADKVTLAEAEVMIKDHLLSTIGNLEPYIGPKSAVQANLLAKSGHFDSKFLDAQMPELASYFSHQQVDVSVPKTFLGSTKKNVRGLSSVVSTHDALADCVSAIEEAKVIRHLVTLIPDTDAYADRALGLNK